MATTTNYSWTTPDDTDLVKDGAAAIRTLGTAIDTTVFTNAGAAIAKSLVDAKGDIIAATADNTVDRLAVGANDTVLTADSSTSTGLKWAASASGAYTLLSTTTLSGSSTTISSINQTYKHLLIIVNAATLASSRSLQIQANGSTTLSGVSGWDSWNGSNISYVNGRLSTTQSTVNSAALMLFNYSNTSYMKNGNVVVSQDTVGAIGLSTYFYRSTTAISSIVLTNTAADTYLSGQVLIYGVN
jgi:hypothetical protein